MSSKPSTFDQIPPQNGKTVVITGGASGIGLRAAQGFAQRGAHVIIGARNAARAERAAADVKRVAQGAEVGWEPLDLAELASVHRFAETLTSRGTPIDILVNCAGVMAIPQRELTVDGFERHFGVNHLGHFALTGLLLPLLGSNGQARVVTVSAQSARSARLDPSNLQLEHGYAPMRAYGNSKIANVLFALELNAHVDPERVLSIPIHPGTANTGIQQYTASRVSRAAGQLIMRVLGQPLDRVADPIAFAATTPDATTNSFVAPTGRFELGGVPGFVSLPGLALDEELRATLWAASERLTGVKY